MHPILALTPKEKQAIALVWEGLSNKEIGEIMKVSHRTIATHLYNASYKLNAKNRIELVLILEGRMEVKAKTVPSRVTAYKLLQIKIKELSQLGLNVAEIAERVEIGTSQVCKHLRKMRLPRRKYTRKIKDEDSTN